MGARHCASFGFEAGRLSFPPAPPPPPPDFALSEPLPPGLAAARVRHRDTQLFAAQESAQESSNLDATRTRGPRRMAIGQDEEKRPRQKSCARNKTQKRLENAGLQFLAKQFGRW